MMEEVRLPRLLRKQLAADGSTLLEAGRLHPAALSVELNLHPLSRASMTLGEEDLPVQMHDLVELYGQNGSLGIFRVNSIATTYKKQRQIQLSHALDVFSDALLPGDMTFTGTVAEALAQIVAGQTANIGGVPFWRLGDCADTAPYVLDVEYTNAMQCLTDLAGREEDYCFAFDFARFPWVLNFVPRDDTVMSEFRLPRNVESCQVTLDDSELCTRLYLSIDTEVEDGTGKKTETTHETHDYAQGQALWGIVSKTAGIRAEEVPNKAEWISRYFARHGTPGVQINISGLELNRLTGEPLDEMRLGRMCRVALPDYEAVFAERIVGLAYPDILRAPARVTVSLANKRQDAGGAFSGLRDKAESTEKKSEKNTKEIQRTNYSLIATDRHVTEQGELLHAAGIEIDPHGVWLFAKEEGALGTMQADLRVQKDRITAEVTRATAAEGELSGRLTVEADRITAEVTRASEAEGALSGRLTVEADKINAEVTRAKAAENTLSGRITVQADKVALVVEEKDGQNVVNAASIVGGINSQEGSYVKIRANTINLDGYVTVSDLNATNANITNLTNGTTTATWVKANMFTGVNMETVNLSAPATVTLKGRTCSWTYITIDGTSYFVLTGS